MNCGKSGVVPQDSQISHENAWKTCNNREVRKTCMQPQGSLITNRKCCHSFSIIWNVAFWPSGPPYWCINLTEENIWMFLRLVRLKLNRNNAAAKINSRSDQSTFHQINFNSWSCRDVWMCRCRLRLLRSVRSAVTLFAVCRPADRRTAAAGRHSRCFLFFSFYSTTSTTDFTGSLDCFVANNWLYYLV